MSISSSSVANRLIIQWNCRSITQNGPLLKNQISSTRPLALLLQETRGPYKVPHYTTFMDPKIVHATKDPAKPKTALGQAAVLYISLAWPFNIGGTLLVILIGRLS